MSYAGEVRVHRDPEWTGNGLRFKTCAEANAYIVGLSFRWTQVASVRVVKSDDPVNYRYNFEIGRAERIPMEEV